MGWRPCKGMEVQVFLTGETSARFVDESVEEWREEGSLFQLRMKDGALYCFLLARIDEVRLIPMGDRWQI